jgi:hypothetical protein
MGCSAPSPKSEDAPTTKTQPYGRKYQIDFEMTREGKNAITVVISGSSDRLEDFPLASTNSLHSLTSRRPYVQQTPRGALT